MELLQTIALLCQVPGGTVEYHVKCQQDYIVCVENKYNNYVKRVNSEGRLPTDDFYDTFLKQCVKEKRR